MSIDANTDRLQVIVRLRKTHQMHIRDANMQNVRRISVGMYILGMCEDPKISATNGRDESERDRVGFPEIPEGIGFPEKVEIR